MRIVVVDGHPAMRLGVKGLLSVMGDAWVVGETDDGEEAMSLVEEARPDLVILGLNLAGGADGVEVCRRLKALPDPPRVLVHAAHAFTDDVSSCLLTGADGYLHKRAGCAELLDAARRVADGERVWAMGEKAGKPGSNGGTSTNGGACLTPKEREVLVLLLRGCSNAEMTEKLHLGLPTVRTHVRSILRKLGVKNRKELFRPRALEA